MILADETPEKLAEMKQRLELDLPFVVDPGGEVGKGYGIMYTPGDHDGHLEPGIFVLTPDRVLRAASYTNGSQGRFAVADALRLVTGIASRM